MRRRGFTLIEVMMALVIFTMAAVVLGSTYVNVLNAYSTVGKVGQREEDIRFARAQLLAEPDRKKAEEGGTFDLPGGRSARWHSEIETSNTADLFQVTFTCELGATGNEEAETVTETFMLLRPTWADPVENTKLRQDAKDRITELHNNRKF